MRPDTTYIRGHTPSDRSGGVSKWYEAQYLAVIQWCHNLKEVSDDFLRVLLGVAPSTDFAT